MNLIRVKTQYQTVKMVELSRKKLVISIGMRWMCLCLWLCWCSSLHAFHSMSRPLTTSKLSHIVTYSTIKKRSDSLELAVSEEEEDVVFAGVKFPPPMATSLRRLRIQNTPSPIQQAAIAPVSSGMSCILHAATGTGKTYAFLLPALKKLYAGGSSKALKTPLQVLIIVPTKELALQVESDVQQLVDGDNSLVYTYLSRLPHDHQPKSNKVGETDAEDGVDEDLVDADEVIGDNKLGVNKNYREAPIWITTPMKLLNLLRDLTESDRYENAKQVLGYFSNIKYMVIDEADRVIPPPNRYVYKASFDTQRKMEQSRRANIATTPFVKSGSDNAVFQSMDLILRATKARDIWFQVVAASATVGRPLRREMFRLINNVNDNVRGQRVIEHEYGGQFPVIRPSEVNNKILHSKIEIVEDGDESEGKERVESRYISIPQGIKHYLLFINDDNNKADNVGSRLALINNDCLLEKSILNAKFQRKSEGLRGIVFIPDQEEVPQALRILRFWGYSNASFIPGYPEEMPQVFTPPHAKVRKDVELFVAPYSGTRGLHIPDINHVFVLKAPKTMDEYLHLAGRTGRLQVPIDGKSRSNQKVEGSVITIVTDDEWKRLKSWQTPLGIRFQILA